MGSGGGTTKTTTDPWKGQQPYLQDVFSKANTVFNNAWGQGLYNTPQSPLYTNYINQASSQQLPGGGALPGALQQGLNAPANLAPQIANVIGAGYDPGLGQRLNDMVRSGYTQNAVTPALLQTAGLGMANPALAQLNETAQGRYLTPDTNPYLQQAVQNALEQTRSTIASQFNKGGRYGSGMMAGVQAQELGKLATSAYSNAYDQERARQLQAQQALGGQFLQGAQLGQTGLAEAAQNYNADLTRQLQAQQAATSGYLQNTQNQMQSQQAGLSGMLDAYRLQQQAAQSTAPALQAMENERLAQLANAAGVQQSLLQMPEQTAWDRLANYLSMIQGSYGSTVGQKTPQPSVANQAVGGAIAVAPAIAQMF